MDEVILQERLFDAPWGDPSFRRLPGMRPVGADDWLRVDEVYARQMALRERYLAERRGEVVAELPEAREAAEEVLDLTLESLARRSDFAVERGGGAAARWRRGAGRAGATRSGPWGGFCRRTCAFWRSAGKSMC